MGAMNEREASEVLAETESELVPVMQGKLDDMKRIWRQCLERDLPVALTGDCGPSCGTKLALLVREEDVPAVVSLLRSEWAEHLEREGVDPASMRLGIEAAEGEEPPCPACGTAAAPVEGACGECGLQLE